MQQQKPAAVVETFVHGALRMRKPWSIADEICIYESMMKTIDLTVASLQNCARRMFREMRSCQMTNKAAPPSARP